MALSGRPSVDIRDDLRGLYSGAVSLDWHPGLCQTVFCEDQGLEFDALMALFGFNKQKVLASAEKYVQQGKLQNAISEYEKVVKNDAKDLTVNNTVGDLAPRRDRESGRVLQIRWRCLCWPGFHGQGHRHV